MADRRLAAKQLNTDIQRELVTTPDGRLLVQDDSLQFIFSEEGRLEVSTMPDIYDLITDDITAVADTIIADVSRASNLVAQCYGTFSAINCIFEGSVNSTNGADGNWVTIQAVRTNANTVETTTGNLSAAPAYGWELSVNAFEYVRIRCTARTSGTQTWVLKRGAYATEPIPAIQTHPVTVSGGVAVTMAANATTTPAKARDAVAGANDTGIPAFSIRRDSPTAVTAAVGDYEPGQVSANGERWVREYSPSTQLAGEKVVTTAATPEALAASTVCRYVLVQAKPLNAASVYVGNATDQFVELEPGAAWSFSIDNLSKIYVKVDSDTDGVNYTGG